VLHCLQKLLLVVLAFLRVLLAIAAVVAAKLIGRIRVVEVLGPGLRHGAPLVGQLKWPLGGKTNLVLLLHLVDFRLLLLHDLG